MLFRVIEHADLRLRLPVERMRGQLNVYDGLGRLLDSRHLPHLFSRDSWIDLDVTNALQSIRNNKVGERCLRDIFDISGRLFNRIHSERCDNKLKTHTYK